MFLVSNGLVKHAEHSRFYGMIVKEQFFNFTVTLNFTVSHQQKFST